MKRLQRLFTFPKSSITLTIMFSFPFMVIFTALLAALMYLEGKRWKQDLITELHETAKAYFEQIVITRLWNSQHSGVYVKISEQTQPNPYLKDDPKRDIMSADGARYTKINPAYMTRQLSDLAYQKGRYKFRITSLRPINPRNKADEWETQQLRLFEEGKNEEAYEITTNNGKEQFRYIAPLFVERPCLQCHQRQDYEEGDVRGGITIDIPIEVPKSIYMASAKRNIIYFGIVGITSLSFIIGITWLLSKKVIRAVEKEVEHERLQSVLHLAGAAAHELRQPMTVLIGVAELLKDRELKSEAIKEDLDIIVQQCFKMDEIIKRMLSITKYKTKNYTDGTEIFDLELGSGADKKDRPS